MGWCLDSLVICRIKIIRRYCRGCMVLTKVSNYLIVLLLLVSFLTFPFTVDAAEQRVYDHAELLTDKEVKSLEKQAEKVSKKHKTNFFIVTITEDMASHVLTYLQDMFDNNELGYGDTNNVAMIGIDIDRRDVELVGFGEAEKKLDDRRLNLIREDITPDLTDGKYAKAFEQFITLGGKYFRYKAGVNPDNIIYKTYGQLGIAFLLSVGIVGLMMYQMFPKVTTTAGTYRDDSRSRLIHQHDRYLRKT